MSKLLFWGLTVLLLAGCGQASALPSKAGSSASQSSPPASLTPLPLVTDNISVGMSRLWLMDSAGIFRKYGFDPKIQYVQAGTDAMISGQFEVGIPSPSAVVAAAAQGADVKLVAALNSKIQYALVASKGIISSEQLRGKTFAIARVGDSSDTATRLIIRRLGMEPDRDVSLLQVGNSPERYAALTAGTVQAMIADPMDVARARRDGFSILADQASLDIPYMGNAVSMRGQFIRDHRDEAKQVLMAFADGVHYYKTHQEEAVPITAKNLKSDDTEAIRGAVKVFAETVMADKPFVTESSARPVLDEVAFRVPSVKGAPLDRFVDNSLLQEIDNSGFIDALYR